MKRCPHCDFIYDDEQDFCDMDGRELERGPAVRRRRRLLALLGSGVILAAILASGYYVRTSHTATGHAINAPSPPGPRAETTPTPEAPASAPDSPPDPARPSPAPPPKAKARLPAEAPRRRAGDPARIGSPAVRPVAPAVVQQGESAARPESRDRRREPKKESKLGAALKKAGRVLKKPFGF